MNSKVKSFFKNKQSMVQCLSSLMSFLEWKVSQLKEKHYKQLSKQSRLQNTDLRLRKKMLNNIQDIATPFASKIIIDNIRSIHYCDYQTNLINNTDIDNVCLTSNNGSYTINDQLTCNCSQFLQYKLPCRHVFYVRQLYALPLFVENMLINRYASFNIIVSKKMIINYN
jgi:hypothetical protein